MPRKTYDASNEIVFNDEAVDPPFAGAMAYNAGNFRAWDQIGTFNVRALWSNILDGPDSAWATTLYKVITTISGNSLFPASVTWYRDSAKSKPVLVKTYNYTGTNYLAPTTIVWQLYNTAGTAVLATCTDTITYTTGTPFETGRTRVFT